MRAELLLDSRFFSCTCSCFRLSLHNEFHSAIKLALTLDEPPLG